MQVGLTPEQAIALGALVATTCGTPQALAAWPPPMQAALSGAGQALVHALDNLCAACPVAIPGSACCHAAALHSG